jgi:hypothetical protein
MPGWKKIGDVARDVTEQLGPRALNVTVCDVYQEPQGFKVHVRDIEQEPLILKIKVERGRDETQT